MVIIMKKNLIGYSKQNILLLLILIIFFGCGEPTVENDVSAKVDKNDNMIIISEEQKAKLNIQTIAITSAETKYKIAAPGFVFPAPDNYFVVSTPVRGRIVALLAHEGEPVRKGELFLEIESSQFGNLVAEYLQANASEKFAKDKYDRIEKLVEKKISSERELVVAEAEYINAKTNVDASVSRLKAVGISDNEIEEFAKSDRINPILKIYSPITGIVDQHLIEMGESVNEYQKLATVINTEKVLVKGYIDPGEGSYVKSGDIVLISLKNQPQNSIEGKVATVSPALDVTNKSIVANVFINTVDNWPRIGENIRMEILTNSPNYGIAIPMSAVVFDGDNAVVFVKHSESKYEKRTVKLSELNAENALVEEGLSDGENIAVSELFALKALSRFEQFSEE